MSALNMLDVAIGIIFIYMLLSIICTAIIEIIEAWLKKRASDLERGIRELLSDPNGVGLARQLYAHPLISGLYRGAAGGPKMKPPAYIPARTFALALMDVILPAKTGVPPGASGAANSTSLGLRATSLQINARAAAAAQSIVALRAAIVAQQIGALATTSASQALLTLVDSAGDDMSKVRENIEGWYNNSMDRVAGWYKRRAQKISLFLGFFIAVAMNIDTIAVLKSLSNDDVLRSTVVAAAAEYAKADNQSKSKTTPSSNSSVGNVSPDTSAETNLGITDTAATSNTEVDSTASQNNITTNVSDSTNSKEGTPKKRIEQAMQQLQELRLPIGWDWPDPTQTAQDNANAFREKIEKIKDKSHPSYAVALSALNGSIQDSAFIADQAIKITNRNLAIPHGFWGWSLKAFGWIITGMAVSLGAPFWFDLLNKVMVIRSTVKPHEKSLEEASEDRQR